jgi:hypothetical protein
LRERPERKRVIDRVEVVTLDQSDHVEALLLVPRRSPLQALLFRRSHRFRTVTSGLPALDA